MVSYFPFSRQLGLGFRDKVGGVGFMQKCVRSQIVSSWKLLDFEIVYRLRIMVKQHFPRSVIGEFCTVLFQV